MTRVKNLVLYLYLYLTTFSFSVIDFDYVAYNEDLPEPTPPTTGIL
jgi:hypothetical protein